MADPNVSPTLQATSALRKSGMSTTLPRNFAPLSLDNDSNEPRTPDQTFAELILPPPPPHSTYRIRRPRIRMDNFQTRNNALPANLFASDLQLPSSAVVPGSDSSLLLSAYSSDDVMPSVETPTSFRPVLQSSLSEPMFSGGLPVPSMLDQPPRTPPAQTNLNTPEIKRSKWEMHRATSVCSHRSDSSVSSSETYATRPTSFDGSATSPDCDNQDPFSPELVKIIPDTPTRRSKKLRQHFSLTKDNVEWSIEMDNHLFNVYQIYLADPTVTPFKTIPGSIPPTGVCHRVARRARDTWPKASRIDVPIIRRYRVRKLLDIRRPVRDTTPEPENFLRTDSTPNSSDARAPWPSESSTRKRLKQLCREKFTISAHYQRLRQSRSPSPFADQFTHRPTSRLARSASPAFQQDSGAGSYTTRDLNISLVASDATAPLARVVAEDNHTMGHSSESFNAPLISSEPMSLSPPAAPETLPPSEPDKLAPMAAKIPRLASPFNYSTWNGQSNKTHHRRHISHNQYDTMHATGSRLLSPFRPEPDVSINVHKRRAQHNLEDELSPSGSNIGLLPSEMDIEPIADLSALPVKSDQTQELIFTGSGDINQRRIRLRNRGTSLGGHLSGMSRVDRLFTPPSFVPGVDAPPMPALPEFISNTTATNDETDSTSLIDTTNTMNNSLTVPEYDPNQKRLGSPFELDPNKRSLRSRSPRHAPSMSDPFISTSQFGIASLSSGITSFHNHNNSIGGIGERLASFTSFRQPDQTPQ